MRTLGLVAALTAGVVGASLAQQSGAAQPQEKLLLLPLTVRAAADSAVSIVVMDAAREKLASVARSRVFVIPKAKMCEALTASGFSCDALLEEPQGRLLARVFSADAFTSGTLERQGAALTARVHVADIGGSGFAASFAVTNGNPGTPVALGEAIAARLNTIIKAGESARECVRQRQRGAFVRALEAARKAFAIEPNHTGAHLCIGTVYETQRMPPDSLIAAAQRALKGDSLNATAWELIARQNLAKGDTLEAIRHFRGQLVGEPANTRLRLGIAQLQQQQRLYAAADTVLSQGLALSPSDQSLIELKNRICIEGELWRCALDGLSRRAAVDTAALSDTSFLKTALGAAQQLSDTQALLRFGHAATERVPNSASFWKALGAAFEMVGRADSAIWAYRRSLAIDPSDLNSSLLVAKSIVDGATYDTAQARRLRTLNDSAGLHALQKAYADRMDTARVYIDRAVGSGDSTMRLNAALIMLTAGSKLAQAQAYDRAYSWLDQVLQLVAPRTPADSVGPRNQIRVNASFWFGLASLQTLNRPYQDMTKSKSCAAAKLINDRIVRTKEAILRGARVHPPTASTLLRNLEQYEALMPRVKQAFKCTNF